ncbi:MAG: DNA-deoxyinosine glycosylase [Kiritimatiellae bacterium]|nr:DNA-deoxyinosine glycosylase [Kiritimatiellia bacterium]
MNQTLSKRKPFHSRAPTTRGPRARSFGPVADPRARVLILGTLPSEASLSAGRYYAHPRNHFWPIMGCLVGATPDLPYEVRLERLREARIALWDVVGDAHRRGSADSEIRRERPNDIPGLLERCPEIRCVLFNGQPALRLFRRHFPKLLEQNRLRFAVLPSTSPAHASRPFAEKLKAWREALSEALV